MSATQMNMSTTASARPQVAPRRGPFFVPPGDFARLGLVDRAFVERSVAIYRATPEARYSWRRLDAVASLRADLAEIKESLTALNRVYGDQFNDWAAATRELLFMEYFTVLAILRGLSADA